MLSFRKLDPYGNQLQIMGTECVFDDEMTPWPVGTERLI